MKDSWWSKLFSRKKSLTIIKKCTEFHEADVMVLEALEKQGADLTQAREVLHYLYLPNQAVCYQVGLSLREDGYDIQETATPWGVIARTVNVVNSETVKEMRGRFEKLAKEYNGVYDGWEAATDNLYS